MPFATINNAKLWYDVMGDGAPLLLHHGYTACRENWLPVAEKLSKHFKVILMECRGTGASEDTADGYTFEQLALDALGMMDFLDIQKFSYAGHSMGGGLGYVLASQFPERLSHLILMAPIPSGGIGEPDPAIRAATISARTRGDRDFFMAQQHAGRFREDVQTDAWMEHRVDQLLRVTHEHASDLVDAMAALDLEAALAEIQIPTLMLAGSADALLPANLADFERLPNAGLHVLSRAGHEVAVHEPQAVYLAILDFMEHGPVSAKILEQRSNS